MIAGIELDKEYVQISVKSDVMKEPESITTIAGTEHYRIRRTADGEPEEELKNLFRRLWKMILPYGNKNTLEYLVFCLEENEQPLREQLLELVGSYGIEPDKVCFLDKAECFCAYMAHQNAELLIHNALLMENRNGKKESCLLHKHTGTYPAVMEIKELKDCSVEDIFAQHAISSVFLVGDDFEEEWMQEKRKILKGGRKVFAGKNLFVKGAAFHGMDLAAGEQTYLYLGEDKLRCSIALKTVVSEELQDTVILQGGKNWYDSKIVLEVLLLENPVLEFVILPMNGKEKQVIEISLEDLPKRPKKTTRLLIELKFVGPKCGQLTIRDLGFGELFPASEMIYEGELQWEQ